MTIFIPTLQRLTAGAGDLWYMPRKGAGIGASKPRRNQVAPMVDLEEAGRDMARRVQEQRTAEARRREERARAEAERQERERMETEQHIRQVVDDDIRTGRMLGAIYGDIPMEATFFPELYAAADERTRAIMDDQLRLSTRQLVADTRQTLSQPSPEDDPSLMPGMGQLFLGQPEQMTEAWNRLIEGSGMEEMWIQKAIKRPGALHKALGIPKDQTIPMGTLRKAAKLPGITGKRARLAITLRGMKRGGVGEVPPVAPPSAAQPLVGTRGVTSSTGYSIPLNTRRRRRAELTDIVMGDVGTILVPDYGFVPQSVLDNLANPPTASQADERPFEVRRAEAKARFEAAKAAAAAKKGSGMKGGVTPKELRRARQIDRMLQESDVQRSGAVRNVLPAGLSDYLYQVARQDLSGATDLAEMFRGRPAARRALVAPFYPSRMSEEQLFSTGAFQPSFAVPTQMGNIVFPQTGQAVGRGLRRKRR